MTAKRRSRGDGSIHWDERRQRFIAEVTVGYTPAGKRITRKASGKTRTEANAKLKALVREYEDGLVLAAGSVSVADAVRDWLAYGLHGRAASTVAKCRHLCEGHIIPALGARKLRDLSAADVDRWLVDKAKTLSTSTVQLLYGCLNRAVTRAMARDKVKRNVVVLCNIPKGKPGRPSKSLTLEQASALLDAATANPLHAYVVVSLLTGARTEELRALTWDHVDLDGQADADPPIPASIRVWHSVRDGGDTKTRKSRRSLALPARCVTALRAHEQRQAEARETAGTKWQGHRLVFTTALGTELDAANVRRGFRRIVGAAGLDAKRWTPRELRHSFVSLLSSSGVPIEAIAELCGHAGTRVTEQVYRHELRPVLLGGAVIMDRIFTEKPAERAA